MRCWHPMGTQLPEAVIAKDIHYYYLLAPLHRTDFSATNKHLRACFVCKLVKTEKQFIEDGCENCTWLDMDDRQKVQEFTTSNFTGSVLNGVMYSYMCRVLSEASGQKCCHHASVSQADHRPGPEVQLGQQMAAPL